MKARAVLLGWIVGGCTSSEPPPRAASASATVAPAPAPVSAPQAATPRDTTAPDGDVIEGTIVGEGPIGDGRCVQKSYEVEPRNGARVWIHFERCGAEGPSPEGLGLEGLDMGATYRFTVKRGASNNFGEDRMLLAAEKLPPPEDASDARIAADLRTLCRRAADRSLASWGQATMMTDEVGSITQRIDQGDEAARCELGRLMRKHERAACKQSIPTLLSSCDGAR